MSKKIYILTCEYNQYDQHGEYLVAWWPNKPSPEELRRVLKHPDRASHKQIEHILAGGGRQHYEDLWYNLHHLAVGKRLYEK